MDDAANAPALASKPKHEMNMWHYLNNNAAEGPVDEARIAELISAGTVAAETLVWTEGMADWMPASATPLAGLFRAAPPPFPVQPPAETMRKGTPPGYRNLGVLAGWITGLLLLAVMIDLVALWSDFSALELLGRIHRHAEFTVEEATASDARQGRIGLAQLIAFLVTVVFFGRWILLAARNVRALGARDLTISPGWAVGYYFIPILNFWRPYQAMKEIWKASAAPLAWEQEPVGALLPCWWTCWIISNLIGQVVLRAALNPEMFGGYDTALGLTIASNALDIPLSIVAMLLVRKLTQRQAAAAGR